MKLSPIALVLLICVALSNLAFAQPTIAADGVRNSASYALAGLPNSSIAQGSIFVVFGSNLGPAKIVQVSSFPLPTSAGLSGTSIQITVNGTSVFAIMLYTLSTQVAAVLPSNTPVGSGTLTVTYNGQTSNSAPITVVKSSFGIFAVNQSGSGQGVLQNVNSQTDRPFNSSTKSAQPGQVIILWGTGLGPVTGNEAGQPLPGDMPSLDVHVFVGGVEAKIQYRGRSGCCVGDDQIVFVVPAGIEGCSLPVYVIVDGVVSNFVTMAVGSNGSACKDVNTLTAAQLQAAQQNGGLKTGTVAVGRFLTDAKSGQRRNDNISASFYFVPLADLGAGVQTPPGTCTVFQFPGGNFAAPTGLDAGTVTAATPVGTWQVPAVKGQLGTYALTLFPGFPNPAPPGVINDGTLLKAGTTNFTWTGGPKVTGGSGSIDFPVTFVWTNDASITAIDRSQPLSITWTGGTSGAIVYVFIQSQASLGVGAELICAADATAGQMVISASLLSALPPAYINGGISQGSLSISEELVVPFTSPGLDVAQAQFTDSVDKGAISIK